MTLNDLPPVAGLKQLNTADAYTGDIIQAIHNAFGSAVEQVGVIAPRFKKSSKYLTARAVWDFLKLRITYVKDTEFEQLIKMPNVFLSDGTGDCKSYSLFAAAIMAANGYPVTFRYAGYRQGSNALTHVYVISGDIIIDGVYSKFNEQKPPATFKDYKMDVYTLSGLGAPGNKITAEHLTVILKRLKNPDGVVASIVRKELARMLNQPITKAPADAGQLAAYTQQVSRVLQKQPNPNTVIAQLAAAELKRLQTGQHDGIIAGIGSIGKINLKKTFKKVGKVAKKVVNGVKTVALAGPRSAFLTLVNLNIKGVANNLKQADQNKLKRTWEKLGGSWSKLQKQIENGNSKKAIGDLEIEGIGMVDDANALLELAKPILALFADLLSGNKKKNKDAQAAGDEAYQEAIEAGANPQQAEAERQEAIKNFAGTGKSAGFVGKIKSLIDQLPPLTPDEDLSDVASGMVKVQDKDSSLNLDKLMVPGLIAVAALVFITKK